MIIKFKLILNFIIVLIIINIIKSDTIEFDAVSTCTLQTPCDFNNVTSWLGGDLPGADDDVVIDYSNSNVKEVYIVAKGLNSTFKSLKILGHTTSDDKSHPHLILTDCTINITNSLSIVRAALYFNQTTTTINKINNIEINKKLELINSSSIYIYNNNIINVNNVKVDFKSKLHLFNNSLLQVNGNSVFENTPVFSDKSTFITFNEKNNGLHISVFKNGLSSISGQVSLGRSEFSGGVVILYNLILNDLVKITNGTSFTINNKLNMISSGSIVVDSSNSKLLLSNTTLPNQQLSNVELSQGGVIVINNPTIQVNKINGSGDIQFDTDVNNNSSPNEIKTNIISQLNSSNINIGIAGNSNVLIKSSKINKLYDFESKINKTNENSNVLINGTVNIGQFNIVNTQITIQDKEDKLFISNLNSNNNLIVDSIDNQGELHLINSKLRSSIDSTGTVVLNNSTLNGYLFLYGKNIGGELNYTLTSTINGFLQLDENGKAIINYNNINDKLIINGNLIINSNYVSIISNDNQNLDSLMCINGDIKSTTSKPSISLFFTSQPIINKSYQLFKLSPSPSSNQNQTISKLLSSIIKPILITDTNHHNITSKLNLKSQYFYDSNNNVYTKFNLLPMVKHLTGWEIFLIITSCLVVVLLVVGIIYTYLNHKRYIGYLPINR